METRLPWHQEHWHQIARRYAAGRPPHALLLTGPPGLGKEAFARSLAEGLLCREAGASLTPCGQCVACHWMLAGTHPDFTRLAPEEAGKALRIGPMRDFCSRLQLTAEGGGRKLGMIQPADAMNPASANALLKTLEEPPAQTLILLVTDRPGSLPATILSRCQRLVFPIPSQAVAQDWLAPRLPADADSELLLGLALGAPLRALDLASLAGLEQRRVRFDAWVRLGQGRGNPLDEAQHWVEWDPRLCLPWMWGWLSDLIRLHWTPNACLLNPDLRGSLQALSSAASDRLLFQYLDEVQEAIRLLNTPINPQLLVEGLLVKWNRLRALPHG